MSTSNNTENKELQAYLDGRDGISATYKTLPADEPSQALDQMILAEASQTQPRREDTRSGYFSASYSIAASLCTFILIGSLFLTRDELQGSLTGSATESISLPPGAVPAQISSNSYDTDATQESVLTEAEKAEPLRQARTTELATDAIVITGSRLRPNTGNSTDQEPGLSPAFTPELKETDMRADMAQALVVEANRVNLADMDISAASSAAFDQNITGQEFRLKPEIWAEEIWYLQKEAETATLSLEEELRLFGERFPDEDLQALLQGYEDQTGNAD